MSQNDIDITSTPRDLIVTLESLKTFYEKLKEYYRASSGDCGYGGIKIGYPQSGKNYPVQLNDDGQAYVTVPWTDTTIISAATSNTLGGIKIGYNGGNADTTNKNYPVKLSDGKAYVNVPWTDNNTTYSAATQSVTGLMSADDKKKLDGIAAEANKYSLPAASSSVLGGVKIGNNITNTNGTISLSKDNVTAALGYTPPSTDTKYSLPAASSSVLGGIKTGYTSTTFNKWAVQLDDDNKAYVTAHWNFGTGIIFTTDKDRASFKAALVSDEHNEKDSSKTNSSNANRFYPVELDKSGKLAVTIPWVNTPPIIYTGKEGINISSSNEIALDLYKEKSTVQNVEVYNPITLSTAIPEKWETKNAEQIYPVVFDKNDKLSVLVKWANTWQANTKSQAGYVAAPPKDSSMQVWMTNTSGIPSWTDLPEPTVTVPQASSLTLGGIKLGYSSTDDDAFSKGRRYGVDVIADTYRAFVEIGTASADNMGVVKVLGKTTSTEVAVKINDNGALYVDPKDIPKSESSGDSSFTLGSATASDLGGIKVGYNEGNANNDKKNYPVQLDEDDKAYVNVPWVNTKYTFEAGLSKSVDNKVSLALFDSVKTEDEVSVSSKTWSTGSSIPENSEYYKCPVCIDKNGYLYVKVPAIKLGSDSVSGGPSPINDNE